MIEFGIPVDLAALRDEILGQTLRYAQLRLVPALTGLHALR